jgi:hypothetical protein
MLTRLDELAVLSAETGYWLGGQAGAVLFAQLADQLRDSIKDAGK